MRLPQVLSLALSLLLACLATAWADPAQERWTEATELMAAGQNEEAVRLLLELSAESPESPLADDALFLAANLQEEKLADPASARETYRRLLARYPESRSALSASRRLDALELAIGSDGAGAEPLARFSDILNAFPNRELQASLSLAKALIADYPDWSELYRVRLWVADTYRRRGELANALQYYQAVLQNDAPPEGNRQASLGAAEIQILRGEYAAANSLLETLRTHSVDASDMHAVAELAALLEQSRSRSRLVSAAKVALAAMMLAMLLLLRRACGSSAAAWTQFRRPPMEFFYMLPFALLMTGMALTGHQEIGPAVASICLGGLVIVWLCGCALRAAQPLSVAHALLCVGTATIASVSLVYWAVYRSALLDLILTTVQFGPE